MMKCRDCGEILAVEETVCRKCGRENRVGQPPSVGSGEMDFRQTTPSQGEDSVPPTDLKQRFAVLKKDIEEIDDLSATNRHTTDNRCLSGQDLISEKQNRSVGAGDRAGFWVRLMAYMIDGTILAMIYTLLAVAACLVMFENIGTENIEEITSTLYGPLALAGMVIQVFYFTYFHGVTGQTIGKRILGLKVVDRRGRLPGLGRSFLRFLGYLVSRLPLYLGFIWIAFDLDCQGWHDKIAGTYVVKI